MNHSVRDLMTDRASTVDAPDLDVAAMVRDGSRRLRRRRAAMTAGVGSLGALALVGASVLPGLLNSTAPAEVTFASSFADREPAWAVGSTVRLEGRDFTVPTRVLAMVQTTAGVVYSDNDGVVWSASGDSPAVQVGSTEPKRPRLVTDGSRAAWTEHTGMGTRPGRDFVVLDQATGDSVRITADVEGPDDVRALALDGEDLYVQDARGLVRVDLNTDAVEVVSPWRGDLEVVDVEQGRIAHVVPPSAQTRRLEAFVSPTVGSGPQVDARMMVDLSDDGRYLLGETEPNTFAVFDVAAGTHRVITSPDHDFLIGYRWLDADTYLALGMNKPYESTPVDLLACDLAGICTVAASGIGAVEDGMTLPIGVPMDG